MALGHVVFATGDTRIREIREGEFLISPLQDAMTPFRFIMDIVTFLIIPLTSFCQSKTQNGKA